MKIGKSKFNLFGQYLRQQKSVFGLLVVLWLVFTAAILLYGLPVAAVGYPTVLFVLLAAVFFAVDFYYVKKKHEQMERMLRLTAAMIVDLPESAGIVEHDYQELVERLKMEIAERETDHGSRYQNMVDYYTTWVHQIKTPIASMRLNLQNEDSYLSRKLTSDLFRIEQYVEMVLAFLRLDANDSDYVFAPCSLDTVIRQSVRKFATEFIVRKLSLDYEPIDVSVVTDEKWLAFVVEQVLSNALKYTREGQISIYLAKPQVLCIEDTGIGIAPCDLPRIFEKGYTGYNGRSDKKASGIGLYLCRRICDNLGAKISAESKVGEGTRICIEFLNERSS